MPRTKKKKNKRGQCPRRGEVAATPLSEEKGTVECRKLAGKNGGIQNFSGTLNAVSPRKQ